MVAIDSDCVDAAAVVHVSMDSDGLLHGLVVRVYA